VPVLTEQAIEGTGGIEDREVLVAALGALAVGVFRIAGIASSGAHPVADAVRGKVVVVPLNERLFGSAREFDKLPANILSHAAIAGLSVLEATGVHAHRASDVAFAPRHVARETVLCVILGMSSPGSMKDVPSTIPKAIHANADGFRDNS
jgi:hypothetical protein